MFEAKNSPASFEKPFENIKIHENKQRYELIFFINQFFYRNSRNFISYLPWFQDLSQGKNRKYLNYDDIDRKWPLIWANLQKRDKE